MTEDIEGSGVGDAVRAALDAGAAGVTAANRAGAITVEDLGRSVTIPVYLDNDGKPLALTDAVKFAMVTARAARLADAAGPDRRTGTITAQAFDSFCGLVTRFKRDETVVYADANARKLLAVLDYNQPGADGQARWGQHRVVYACPLSEPWQAWGGALGLGLDQEALALLLDKRDRELVSGKLPDGKTAPAPADLITIANDLETYADKKVKRDRDPNTQRVRLAYSDESGFLGDLRPPPSFLVQIPVFQDGAPQTLEVRLRAAVAKDGTASFALGIHAADDVLRDAFDALVSRCGEATGCPVFLGLPEQQ